MKLRPTPLKTISSIVFGYIGSIFTYIFFSGLLSPNNTCDNLFFLKFYGTNGIIFTYLIWSYFQNRK